MIKDKEKFILYLGGGTMAGVFGAGVLSALQEMDIYNQIEVVYAGSGGAANGAYFLSKQKEVGTRIYFEDLTHDFILKRNFIKVFCQRIFSIFWKIPLSKMDNLIDLEYLFNIFKNDPIKRLDIEKIKNQSIPFYVRIFNLEKKKNEYRDIHNSPDFWKFLKASMSIVPYSVNLENINGNQYIDGTILNLIDFKYLRKKYPDQKIVVIFNENSRRNLFHFLKSFLEGLGSTFIYGGRSIGYFLGAQFKLKKDIKLIQKDKKAIFISPPVSNPTSPITIDVEKLKKTYQMGKKEVQKIKNFIK